ncbi:hypothetical protein Q8F55_004704 [Vanrija albida]|uniref:DUF3074 domain-containing protein n=1 Tax=Vanrija albida TaxID=181172 RepID=A0ABR3Q7H5_9TREE
MGCAPSTPRKDESTGQAPAQPPTQPPMQQLVGQPPAPPPAPPAAPQASGLVTRHPTDDALSAYHAAFRRAIFNLTYEMSLWSLTNPIRQFLVYFVDDPRDRQVLIIFHNPDGTFSRVPEQAGEAFPVTTIKDIWDKLCVSNGELGVDRPVRVVLSYTPDKEDQPTEDKNLVGNFSWTLVQAGFPTWTAAAGSAEWLRLLQTQGVAAADRFIDQFKNGNGDEIRLTTHMPLMLDVAKRRTPTNEQMLSRIVPVLLWTARFNAILPQFVRPIFGRFKSLVPEARGIWIYTMVSQEGGEEGQMLSTVLAAGGPNPPDDKRSFREYLGPLHSTMRGERSVDYPSRVLIKYINYQGIEDAEVDVTWLPDLVGYSTMAAMQQQSAWSRALHRQGEEAAMSLIHSTPAFPSKTGDINMGGNPAYVPLKGKWSPAFKSWVTFEQPEAVLEAVKEVTERGGLEL